MLAARQALPSLRVDDVLRARARAGRADVAAGVLRGAALGALLDAVPFRDRDCFADELLGLEEPAPDQPDLPRGSVPYLPCGVDEILAAVREAPIGPHDELVDLGSGLGRVLMLAHLLSGARCHGVEIQEPLVRAARVRCAALSLSAITFTRGDAADIALDGSVFFLYAPFGGETLARVVRRLEDVARRRPVVVCAVGLELTGVPWLTPRKSSMASLALYDSA